MRELENLVERAMILRHAGEPLAFDDLVGGRRVVAGAVTPEGEGELLGVNPNTLRHRMRKLGIPFRKQLRSG